ncbi:hypothetical protein JOF36_003197 [Pseudonocardia parietis]|uniref:Polyketide cyclase/dehydrase/lipid transport protein n=1 Tax=Pseudonocardia parietis TaxID=570936 RepID=A0ABS4VUA9_9PSEU|nr:hypothetical protein [Pseudonocardia parietis]
MSTVRFMSPEHIAAMNALLEDAPAVRAECARLPRPRVVSYALTDGPDGQVVHWTMTFSDTIRFSLEKASAPDVRFVGDWARMIRATSAGRDGTQVDPGSRWTATKQCSPRSRRRSRRPRRRGRAGGVPFSLREHFETGVTSLRCGPAAVTWS